MSNDPKLTAHLIRKPPSPAGCKNTEELHAVLTSSIMIRRRKADVLAQLPPKQRQQVLLHLPRDKEAQLAEIRA